MIICLLGSIPKGDEERMVWKDWKVEYKEKLSVIPNIKFTDGDEWKDETRPLDLVGHDLNLIKTADVVVVNAETKLGAGTAQEMVVAKYFKKPVITVLPKDTHHRKSNVVFSGTKIDDWIHPFILTFSDIVVKNIEECVTWTQNLFNNSTEKRIKDLAIIDEAIRSYLKTRI